MSTLDVATDYADDGVDGGNYEAVLTFFQGEVDIMGQSGLRNIYD